MRLSLLLQQIIVLKFKCTWEKMEAVRDFIFLDSKITVVGDCSHESKSCLLLGKKAVTNVDSIKKQRHHFADKGLYIVKAMVFPVVIYE